jgi:SAM-dependent methyltransferase/uncharacterized protein YbaR (Trm112 family)
MLDPWFVANLVCPRDLGALHLGGGELRCPSGHGYPIVDGVPVMLRDDVTHTLHVADQSLRVARGEADLGPQPAVNGVVDPYVQRAIGATNGILYNSLIGRLTEYPIPQLRLPPGRGERLLDVGCNWGRWCVAAARQGYRPVGIDPGLEGVLAATRVARQLGVRARFVVADARYLPFRDGFFDRVFSYSVLQHFAKADALAALREMGRVLEIGGESTVQMLTRFGARSLYQQARRRFRAPRDFEVRYWRPAELEAGFGEAIGPSHLSVDGFFSANAQRTDTHLLPLHLRSVVHASEALRQASASFPVLTRLADSLYVRSTRARPAELERGALRRAA